MNNSNENSAKYLMQNPGILKKYIRIKLDFLQECKVSLIFKNQPVKESKGKISYLNIGRKAMVWFQDMAYSHVFCISQGTRHMDPCSKDFYLRKKKKNPCNMGYIILCCVSNICKLNKLLHHFFSLFSTL